MRCQKCKFNYQHTEVIQPLITSWGTKMLCAICALRGRNRIHGIPLSTPFQGEEAQRLYDLAMQERRERKRR